MAQSATQQHVRSEGSRPIVVHLVPVDGLGGVETAARSAAEHDLHGLDFRLMFLAGRTIANNHGRVMDSPGRSLNDPRTFVSGVRDLLALRPDILVCSLWRSMIVGMAVKILHPRTRLVCFLHLPVATHAVDQLLHALCLRMADEVWADSQVTLDCRARGPRVRSRIISFVTDEIDRTARPAPAPRFVSWSRLHRQKGHDRALDLIARLTSVDARLDIWGPNDGEGEALRRLAAKLEIASAVRLRGPVERAGLADIAAEHTFFLQLSRNEGMGMSVVEAMQLGLVPVVTAVGEIPHYVRDGDNGLLVDPGHLDAAAGRIAELLGTPGAIEGMAARAAETWTGATLYRDSFRKSALDLAARSLRPPSTKP